MAAFGIAWDGTVPGKTEPAEGVFQVVAQVIANTPVVGTTKTISKNIMRDHHRRRLQDEHARVGYAGKPVGPSFNGDWIPV